MEPCKGCGASVGTLYATKETKNRASGWRCEECWWRTERLRKKKVLGKKMRES